MCFSAELPVIEKKENHETILSALKTTHQNIRKMRYFTSLAFVFMLPLFLNAQYLEVGAMVGASGYKGDLSENRITFNEMGLTMGVFGRYHFNKFIVAKANITRYSVAGNDSNARKVELRERNLHFRSDVIEFGLTGEINLMGYNLRANQTGVPYLTTGVSFFKFNPQAQMEGRWYDLEPLQTEGTNYKTTGFAIPLGLGFRFNINYRLNFGFEAGYRFTFTDRLDDVSGLYPNVTELRSESIIGSQLSYRTPELTGEFGTDPFGTERGDASNNDRFFYLSLTLSVNLTDKYGLDFDEKYQEFKTPLKKSKEERIKEAKKKAKVNRRTKIKTIRKKLRDAKKNDGREMKPATKKRTE